jgi:hypothetical protein
MLRNTQGYVEVEGVQSWEREGVGRATECRDGLTALQASAKMY